MNHEERKLKIKSTENLLKEELNRIIELLEVDERNNAELRNKMLEARRDMLRLEKLIYLKEQSNESVEGTQRVNRKTRRRV